MILPKNPPMPTQCADAFVCFVIRSNKIKLTIAPNKMMVNRRVIDVLLST
jgi:hypothetical protein